MQFCRPKQYPRKLFSSIKSQSQVCQLLAGKYHPARRISSSAGPISSELENQLHTVLYSFHAPIRYAFGYGSGVFKQRGYSDENPGNTPQVDLIFGVTHPEHWHSLNLKQNPHHYSCLRWLGSRAVSTIQDKYGAGIYYNPYVEINGLKVKYGVVSIETLCKDLTDWNTLYLAGRMQKPIHVLRDSSRVHLHNSTNHLNALRVALLKLPMRFSEEDLLMTITGLSYLGDPRNTHFENPFKTYNIVHAQFERFQQLYQPLLQSLPNITHVREGMLAQDDNPKLRGGLITKLPPSVKRGLMKRHKKYLSRNANDTDNLHLKVGSIGVTEKHDQIKLTDGSLYERELLEEEFWRSCAVSPDIGVYVDGAISDIIRWPARTQSLKGLFTAGVSKSVRYLGEKWRKRKDAVN